jgi:hypothetical protein
MDFSPRFRIHTVFIVYSDPDSAFSNSFGSGTGSGSRGFKKMLIFAHKKLVCYLYNFYYLRIVKRVLFMREKKFQHNISEMFLQSCSEDLDLYSATQIDRVRVRYRTDPSRSGTTSMLFTAAKEACSIKNRDHKCIFISQMFRQFLKFNT